MKKIFTLIIVSVFSLALLNAQEAPPQALSFKATIVGNNGQPLFNRTINLRISILLEDDINSAPVYSEMFSPTTNGFGQVNVEIGRGIRLTPGYFSDIEWGADEYYLGIEVDIKQKSEYDVLSITQLLSVPYALYAGSVGNNDDADADPENELITAVLLNGTNLEITEATVTQVVDLSSITSDLTLAEILTNENDAGLIRIINLGDPVEEQDAVTKSYVDLLESRIAQLEAIVLPSPDEDNDGFTIDDGDCNDLDPTIYPGAPEICGDGIDQDCNGSDVSCGPETVTDYDGNIYQTVQINGQCWMAENLKTTKYNDGESIPIITTDIYAWSNTTYPAFCWPYNDKDTYGDIYGAFYNWYAVNTGKLCPDGWHVPTDAEWTALVAYLEGADIAGGKMKETGTVHWLPPNTGATNESGFTGLPGNYRESDGTFFPVESIGSMGCWWTISPYESSYYSAWMRSLLYDDDGIFAWAWPNNCGLPVRCIMD